MSFVFCFARANLGSMNLDVYLKISTMEKLEICKCMVDRILDDKNI